MGSPGVDFFFLIKPHLAIDVCNNTLSENTERVKGSSKTEFKKLLPFATKESDFTFNRKHD